MNPFLTNNKAVLCLQQGNFEGAIALLQSAMQKAKTILVQTNEEERSVVSGMETSSGLPLESVPILLSPSEDDTSGAPLPFFVRAFCFKSIVQEDEEYLISQTQISFLIAVVLFNLAAAHNFKASLPNKRGEHLQISLKLYQLVFWTLQDMNIFGDYDDAAEDCDSVYILLMAVLNNIASIHAHFFNLEETAKSLDLLDTVMTHCEASVSDDHYEDYLSFRLTAMLHSKSMLLLAPCA